MAKNKNTIKKVVENKQEIQDTVVFMTAYNIHKFNIYGFALGDYLQISKDYFEDTINLTSQLVAAIATKC